MPSVLLPAMPLKEKHSSLFIILSSRTLVILGGSYRAHVINVIYKNYERLLEIFDNVTETPAGWDDESLGKFRKVYPLSIDLINLLVTSFSNNLLKIERSDIGR